MLAADLGRDVDHAGVREVCREGEGLEEAGEEEE